MKRILLIWLVLGVSLSVRAADMVDVARQLTNEVKQAQTQLSAAETQISRERAQLAQQFARAQQRVLELRDKTAATRRLNDEKTLGLSQIESRLSVWQEQSRFQQRLLTGFLDKARLQRAADGKTADFTAQLGVLQQYVEAQVAALHPQWQAQQIVLANGEVAAGKTLTLGPVQWYVQPEQEEAGLAVLAEGVLSSRLAFSGSAADELLALHEKGEGAVTFDPTLTRALKLAESEESWWDMLVKGGFWVLPIIGFGVFATVIAVRKALFLYRLPVLMPALALQVRSAVTNAAALAALKSSLGGAQAELLEIALNVSNQTHRDEQLYACLLRWRHQLEKGLGAIALTASVSPLLGLVGTVSGMITTFKLMTLFGSSDANTVSAGISEAMINTYLGLVVAVPALIAHALMSRLVKNHLATLENQAVELSQLPVAGGTAA